MVKQNPHLAKLNPTYLFDQSIDKTHLIDLSIGDTSQPLSSTIVEAFQKKASSLGTDDGYEGYGSSYGVEALRKRVAQFYNSIDSDEIFISDGAKCDVGRLQLLFKPGRVALQNPAYPVYRDVSTLIGSAEIIDLPCTPENNFFPEELPTVDLIYLCSPNNPTGTVLSKEQLKRCVDHAKKCGACIIFDAAYASFIQDPTLPRSIYEIEGAEDVAIEVNSFSKMAGFTGIRLGWTVIPKGLRDEDGNSLHESWKRITATFFNGASSLSQAGGLRATPEHISHYLDNAQKLRAAFTPLAKAVYGGEHAPFLWIDFGKPMWDFFVKEMGILTIPGEGFGSCGKGFLRLSALGSKEIIEEVCQRCSMLTNTI